MSRPPVSAALISRRSRKLLSLITGSVAVILAGTSLTSCIPQPTLAQVTQANAKYGNLGYAEARGYALQRLKDGSQCVEDQPLGAQGEQYIAAGRFRDLREDPLAPEGLLYDVLSGGQRKLVGVEYLVPKTQWDKFHGQPPVVLGQRLSVAGSIGLDLPTFYSLHVWLYLPNPSGVFNDWNPKLACRA
jgi:hypothetical protein